MLKNGSVFLYLFSLMSFHSRLFSRPLPLLHALHLSLSFLTCMPSCPEMPTPTSATWIILTSLAPSPEINAAREEESSNDRRGNFIERGDKDMPSCAVRLYMWEGRLSGPSAVTVYWLCELLSGALHRWRQHCESCCTLVFLLHFDGCR